MKRAATVFPITAMLQTGANVSLGSDFPAPVYVADYRVLNAITQAVTRQMIGKPDMPVLGGKLKESDSNGFQCSRRSRRQLGGTGRH